ncbi:PIF1 helicase-like protein [Trypanosoma conorhini]|uniref:Oxidation resistance protein 1 n=1 Tax=Trypanosoma conorhini TaxID=83891 RepID=A0A422NAP9_9TRYP|nr:PIF1 helicase-like protein [Trypanosoma conorhini]RNF02554.1 PIF1 helicase-like protein [Trypanosoma conorhini]
MACPAPRLLGFAPGEEVHCILPESLSATIANALPSSCRSVAPQEPQWHLLYSSQIHGRSFQKLVQGLVDKGPTLIVIKAQDSANVFGGFSVDSWRTVAAREKQDKSRSAAARRAAREGHGTQGVTHRPVNQNKAFFGGEGCFLFTDKDGGVIYRAKPSVNSNFMYFFDSHPLSDKIGIGMGGEPGHFGWFLDRWLERGACHGVRCATFGNPRLTDAEEWQIDVVEAYAVLPNIVEALSKAPQATVEDESCLKKHTNDADKVLLQLSGFHTFDCQERPEC